MAFVRGYNLFCVLFSSQISYEIYAWGVFGYAKDRCWYLNETNEMFLQLILGKLSSSALIEDIWNHKAGGNFVLINQIIV